MLLVDDRQAQVGKADIVLEEGVGSHGDLGVAERQGLQLLGAGRALVAAGQEDDAQPLRLHRLGDGLEVLARQDLGRRHQGRLQPRVGDIGHGQHGHHGLARPHIALQQPAHPVAGTEVAADLGQGHGLGPGQAEGQGGLQPFGVRSSGNDRRGFATAGALALGHGQLMGEELIVGQSAPMRGVQEGVGLDLRSVQGLQRLAPAREAFARLEGAVLPFGQLRRPLQGLVGQPADRARRQARRGWIDGFEARDFVRPLGGQHIVGMVDLIFDALVPALHPAADRAQGSFRMLSFQAVAEHFEIDQEKEPGLVGDPDAVGLGGRASGQMGVDAHHEDLHLVLARLAGLGMTALHHARGGEQQHVPHQGPGQALHQRRELGPDTFQRGRGREQGEENLRPHGRQHTAPRCGTGEASPWPC